MIHHRRLINMPATLVNISLKVAFEFLGCVVCFLGIHGITLSTMSTGER